MMGLLLVVAVIPRYLNLGSLVDEFNCRKQGEERLMLILVAPVAAFRMMWGFWIGSILMLVGAVMASRRANARVEPESRSINAQISMARSSFATT